MYGASQDEIADFFQVSRTTVWRWQQEHEDFRNNFRIDPVEATERVTMSLYHKAIGYTYDVIEQVEVDGEMVERKVRKHIPPSDTACIFWLKNRRPDLWRDRVDLNGKIDHDHEHKHLHVHAQLQQLGLDLSRYTAEQLQAIEEFASVLEGELEKQE